jgi:hypothetical protein
MACTFAPALPTNKDWVRLLTGDTDVPAGCVLSDEEINALVDEVVAEHGSGVHTKYCAASLAGTALAAVALSTVSAGDVLRKAVGRLSITRQSGVDVRTAYQSHIDSLEARCNELMVPRPRTFESVGKVRP